MDIKNRIAKIRDLKPDLTFLACSLCGRNIQGLTDEGELERHHGHSRCTPIPATVTVWDKERGEGMVLARGGDYAISHYDCTSLDRGDHVTIQRWKDKQGQIWAYITDKN